MGQKRSMESWLRSRGSARKSLGVGEADEERCGGENLQSGACEGKAGPADKYGTLLAFAIWAVGGKGEGEINEHSWKLGGSR